MRDGVSAQRQLTLFGSHSEVLSAKRIYRNFWKSSSEKTVLAWRSGFGGVLRPALCRLLDSEESELQSGLEIFVAANQPQVLLDIRNFLTRQRSNCQPDLSTFRNDFLEHLNAEVAATVDRFHDRKWDHTAFIAVWRTIAERPSTPHESRFMPGASIT